MPETLLSASEVLLFGRTLEDLEFTNPGAHPGKGKGRGHNKLLGNQLENDAHLARIYAFSFEGAFYELPSPVVFVVHGDGTSVTAGNQPKFPLPDPNLAVASPGDPYNTVDVDHTSRAPLNPDVTGVAAADFQFADDILYWPYDKADYSIRMDVMTGQLEQILLEVYFEVEAPMIAGGRVAGGRVAGGRVAGGRVAGGRVAGGRVAGGRVSGGRVGGSGD